MYSAYDVSPKRGDFPIHELFNLFCIKTTKKAINNEEQLKNNTSNAHDASRSEILTKISKNESKLYRKI